MLDNSGNQGSKTRIATSWSDPVLISTGRVSPFPVQVPDDDCVTERDRHDLQRDYDRGIESFNRRYSDPGRAFAAATIKAAVA